MKLHKTYLIYTFLALSMLPSFVYAMEPPAKQQLTQEEQNKFDQQLYDAARDGELQRVKEALDAGADVNITDERGVTPLLLAAQNGHKDVVKLLLAQGAKVNVQALGFDKISPLRQAVQNCHKGIVRMILMSPGVDVDIADSTGFTPLYQAALYGYTDIVKMLLEVGADVDKTEVRWVTPLFVAAQDGHKEIVKFLLAKGAKVNKRAPCLQSRSALHQAAQQGHQAVVKRLLDAGAIINMPTSRGDIPLMYTAHNGHTDVVNILLTYIPQPEREKIQQSMLTGMLALLRAQPREGEQGTVQLSKDTRRYIAQILFHEIIAERMAQLKAQLVHQNNNGLMAVECALMGSHTELAKLLNPNMGDESVKKLCNQIENNVRHAIDIKHAFSKIEGEVKPGKKEGEE